MLARDAVESRARAVLAERPDVVAAYLFGSVARGTAGPPSDVDMRLPADVMP